VDNQIQMKNPILLYKKLGQTPLECLLEYKNKIGEERSMTYAGRLDPMAEGLLLCLAGEECKNKDQYLRLNKKYIFEILIGFSTDTHDLLGLVTGKADGNPNLQYLLNSFVGKHNQTYPIYSSKTINGKQLHTLARAGLINENEIPSREVEIFSLKILRETKIGREKLLQEIVNKIALVKGDFRQQEIAKKWLRVLSDESSMLINNFSIIKVEMFCSSGTYVRALVRDLGTLSKVSMCTYSIVRTEVGEYRGVTSTVSHFTEV
jgi:tRNA pseudouridine(55) synthase